MGQTRKLKTIPMADNWGVIDQLHFVRMGR